MSVNTAPYSLLPEDIAVGNSENVISKHVLRVFQVYIEDMKT